MLTATFEIKRVKNPHPKKWPGPWFSFRNTFTGTEGQAHWTTLYSYIGLHDWERVKVHFKCLRKIS